MGPEQLYIRRLEAAMARRGYATGEMGFLKKLTKSVTGLVRDLGRTVRRVAIPAVTGFVTGGPVGAIVSVGASEYATTKQKQEANRVQREVNRQEADEILGLSNDLAVRIGHDPATPEGASAAQWYYQRLWNARSSAEAFDAEVTNLIVLQDQQLAEVEAKRVIAAEALAEAGVELGPEDEDIRSATEDYVGALIADAKSNPLQAATILVGLLGVITAMAR